jgi:HEAT repeat protein
MREIDSKKPSVSRPAGERIKLFWLVWLSLVLMIVILVLIRSHRPPMVQKSTREPATNPPVAETVTVPKISPLPRAVQHTEIEMEPETARLVSVMSDKTLSLQLRRQAAKSLAKIGTDAAMAALKVALTNDSPPYVKAAIAESLGESPNPEARDLLHELVNGKNETTARAAARGLAALGDADAVETLGGLMFNEQTPLSMRTEAALALGDVNLPSAQDQLVKAVSQIQDEDVVESVLDGLGRRPFADTEDFFRNYLNSSSVPAQSKVLAIEAITDAEGNVGPFLSNYANDADPDVRAAVKKALDFIGPTPTPAQ